MDCLSQPLAEVERAISSGDRVAARAIAIQISEQWPHLADGWLLRSWLSDDPEDALRFARRAATLEQSRSTREALAWSRAWRHEQLRHRAATETAPRPATAAPGLPSTPSRMPPRKEIGTVLTWNPGSHNGPRGFLFGAFRGAYPERLREFNGRALSATTVETVRAALVALWERDYPRRARSLAVAASKAGRHAPARALAAQLSQGNVLVGKFRSVAARAWHSSFLTRLRGALGALPWDSPYLRPIRGGATRARRYWTSCFAAMTSLARTHLLPYRGWIVATLGTVLVLLSVRPASFSGRVVTVTRDHSIPLEPFPENIRVDSLARVAGVAPLPDVPPVRARNEEHRVRQALEGIEWPDAPAMPPASDAGAQSTTTNVQATTESLVEIAPGRATMGEGAPPQPEVEGDEWLLPLPADAEVWQAPDDVPTIARSAEFRPEEAIFALWPERNDPAPYIVQENDTITTIANKFGLQPTTILWANEEVEDAAEFLRVGQELLIPPLDGVLHTVQEGDTLASIGETYGIDPELISWFPGNHLDPAQPTILPGQRVMVPAGRKETVVRTPPATANPPTNPYGGSGYFAWPTGGYITTLYGATHGGIDIAAPMSTPIFAAESGEIVFSGWDNSGYGYAIVINHHNGWSTRYAHLSGMYYQTGQWVERGQLIAVMGSTGRSTGPHLHFEVMYRGYRYNPFDYLRR